MLKLSAPVLPSSSEERDSELIGVREGCECSPPVHSRVRLKAEPRLLRLTPVRPGFVEQVCRSVDA